MDTDFYGLTDRPFQLTPDPRFYFGSQTHRKAMAYLGYGLAQGEGFIVITGEIGAGKTTLVGHLLATIDRAHLTVIQIGSTQIDGDDILRMAAQGLGLATEGLEKAQVLSRIEQALNEQARLGKRTLLIVDEAQNLPMSALEELRMLSNFQSAGNALVQIVLLGQPEFRAKIQSSPDLEQLRQRIIATHHLDPMNEDEIEAYFTHRLKLAGWTGRPRFTADAVAALYRHTHGVPRRLNMLLTRSLLHGAIERLDDIDAGAIDAAQADLLADGQGGAAPRGSTLSEELAAIERPRMGFGDRRPPLAAGSSAEREAALLRRITTLEVRVEEQDAALRRMLSLLVDWVEGSNSTPQMLGARRNNAA